MTTNGMIAAVNLTIGLAFVALGLSLLWQAWLGWRRVRHPLWPVSALVALAGPYLGAGIVWLHLTGWRLGDVPGEAWDRDGLGTLVLRLVVAFVALALVRRIVTGRLLTEGDRRRVDGPR